eukprot:TRINITY_DN10994_c0_g1_i2.p1 TRINITY_DN10994_c0_g1~~TRINITY_DN10994_c0_g1_i2.p1  ORF type:complete len:380 (+),score=101.79 TRINITY_DN10994_c0_g1_i2:47-1141(+)
MLSRRAAGVSQRSSQLWREGVRPDKGHFGYDPQDTSNFPKWFVPQNADFYRVPKDEAVLRDRLAGVKRLPGQYAAHGKGKLLGWVLVNRSGHVVVRNPYSGSLDDMGKLHTVSQCKQEGWTRPTMMRITAKDGDTETELFTTMQGILPWSWQEHWHPKVMKATWDSNCIDIFNALQELCKAHDRSYTIQELDLSQLPISRFTQGHPSPPVWKLPIFPSTRRHIDKVESGWDESAWNSHPAPFGEHKNSPAVYPEFRVMRKSLHNQLDNHLMSFGKHPYFMAGQHGVNYYGTRVGPNYSGGMLTNNPDAMRVVPASTAQTYRLWTLYENKSESTMFDGHEGGIGPWPMQHPIRGRNHHAVGPLPS